jgi:hypothetical protein
MVVSKVKRKPTLADMFLATSVRREIEEPHFHETTCDHLRQAHRFVFDDQATEYVGEMIRTMPRIIADAQDFAIPPFEKTWIEFDSRVLFKAVTCKEPDVISDFRLGYLITGPLVRVIVNSNDEKMIPEVLPLQYKLFQPFSFQQELEFCQKTRISRIALDAMYWGSAADVFLNEQDKEGLRSLRENHSIELCCLPQIQDRIMDELAYGQAGDLRNIIAFLLFLNRTRGDIYLKEVGHAQALVRHQVRPLLKHSVIHLKLNPIPRLRKLIAGPGVWRRLHDVRGHFCHNKEAKFSGCMHEWEETKPLHWECKLKCGGVRWWRHEHQRGHADKGTVTSHYKVTE